MCIDWMQLFFTNFLIFPYLKIHFSWKDILHQQVKTTLPLTFPKKIISCFWPKHLTTDPLWTIKLYELCCNAHWYSWGLLTADATLMFTDSVNNTNITAHTLQSVTVMNQDTLQHFPPGSTSKPLSHTTLHLTKVLVRLTEWTLSRCLYIIVLLFDNIN